MTQSTVPHRGTEEARHSRCEGEVLVGDIISCHPDLEEILVQGHFLTSVARPSHTAGLPFLVLSEVAACCPSVWLSRVSVLP